MDDKIKDPLILSPKDTDLSSESQSNKRQKVDNGKSDFFDISEAENSMNVIQKSIGISEEQKALNDFLDASLKQMETALQQKFHELLKQQSRESELAYEEHSKNVVLLVGQDMKILKKTLMEHLEQQLKEIDTVGKVIFEDGTVSPLRGTKDELKWVMGHPDSVISEFMGKFDGSNLEDIRKLEFQGGLNLYDAFMHVARGQYPHRKEWERLHKIPCSDEIKIQVMFGKAT